MDIVSTERRSEMMSRVKDRHTKPELILRLALHRLGFRYTLNNRKLQGKPDLVLRKYQSAIFVHGCFWHQHPSCPKSTIPRTNTAFWRDKLGQNILRDKITIDALESLGWRVIIVWECELEENTIETILRVVNELKVVAKGKENIQKNIQSLNRLELLRDADKMVKDRLGSAT